MFQSEVDSGKMRGSAYISVFSFGIWWIAVLIIKKKEEKTVQAMK